MSCGFCGSKISVKGKVSRNDSCPNCSRDLRCCKQCDFYDPHAYNECREVLAERIADKERANFCEYFVMNGLSRGRVDRVQEAKNALEALFRK
ncbi:MAG: hypothetical protein SV775_06695 [Thermodesulfobacteriota bacterium]|nr:hypothetical protein [Thermodesulfobacteriota bacterium]